MSTTTNMNKSHVSHLLSQATNTGKSMNKETDEFNDIYTGPQLSPLISVPSVQNMKAAKSASKYTETTVLPTVLKRVGTLESYLEKCKKKLKHALSIIKDRDIEIIKLKEQVRLLQDDQEVKRFSKSPPNNLSEFLQLSESLENRVSAIENFLKGDPFYWYKSNLTDVDPLTNNFEYAKETDTNEIFDLDSVLLQINELNFEASEIHICQHTKQGAVFQNCQSVSLTFYANGMQLEGHEFREYSDIRSQNFIKDILDGYFPSELQEEYPRGVIFNVGDRRSIMYEENKELNLFRGKGCRLNSSSEDFSSKERSKRRRFVSIFDHRTQKEQSTSSVSDYPSGTITQVLEASRDHFRRRLPESITKSRINLLSDTGSGEGSSRSIYRMTSGKSLLPDVIIKDGEVCNKKNRRNKSSKKMDVINDAQIKYLNPETINTDSSVQLKIRSINDKELFVLTMGVNDPVRKLRTYLPDEVKECNIMHYKDSCNRVYLNEDNSTLKEYGIVNNSVLVLIKPKVKKSK